MGSPSSFGRRRPFMSLNSCAFIENLSSSERARARARANPAKNNAQKGRAVLGIEFRTQTSATEDPPF